MEKNFGVEYDRLNDAQRQAVDQIEGPVLIVAGPGTGKTQILSLRVANIMRITDTDPSSILCLTFTNFAATNMRERLNQFLGTSAHNVKVRTFHSFASELMQLYPEYFWNGARLTNVPDAVQLDIIQNILTNLPLDDPLAMKFADNFTALSDVKDGLKLVKEAGLTPQKLVAIVKANLAYIKDVAEPRLIEILEASLSIKKLDELWVAVEALPDQQLEELIYPLQSLSTVLKGELSSSIDLDKELGKTTYTGKWKRKWIQTVNSEKGMYSEIKRNQWWLSLAEVYESYRQHLHARGFYDYSDMIIEVLTVLEQNQELRASVQESFLYVLIDEFQDANKAQIRLAQLVANNEATNDEPNIMAVGDDDQSIFAFNGAELNNMLNFKSSYKSVKMVVLTENYRSTQAILDTARSVIIQSSVRLINQLPELDKKLIAQAKLIQGEIKHFSYPTKEHQLSLTSERIKQSWEADGSQSLVVLARNHSSLRQISFFLQQAGVPIRYERQNNILELPLIQQLELLAEIVVAINAGDNQIINHHLRHLLNDPSWQIDPEELWKLAVNNYTKRENWLDSLSHCENQELVNLHKWLLWLAARASQEQLPTMIEYLLGLRTGEFLTSPLRENYLALNNINSTYLSALSGLNILREMVYEFSASRENIRLTDFVRFVSLNRDLGRQIVDESWFISSERAVELMTIHKAKGLEFDEVYILDAVESEWQPRHIGRKPPANLPLQPYGEDFNDYARLAFVAVTRSRRSLFVSSYYNDAKGQKTLASPLFASLPFEQYDSSHESVDQTQRLIEANLSWPRLENDNEKVLLTPRLENYKLSATGLLRYLDISQGGPTNFLERELLRLPEITTTHMAYGTAIHVALEAAQNLTNNNQFELSAIKQAYQAKLMASQLPLDSINKYLPHGIKIIDNLFNQLGFKLEKGGQAEVSFSNVMIGKVPVTGALDHVQFDNGNLLITDYKTGVPLSGFATRDQTKAIKAWRHRTQLLFYCLLASSSNQFRNIRSIRARVVYVEAENPKQLSLTLEADKTELDQLNTLVHKVWLQIQMLQLREAVLYPQTIDGIEAFISDLTKQT
jgi:DNA helicase-2/ATP-dependent DNA helicase PcrA